MPPHVVTYTLPEEVVVTYDGRAVVTTYADGMHSRYVANDDDAFHAERLRLRRPAEHALAHDLAHHLQALYHHLGPAPSRVIRECGAEGQPTGPEHQEEERRVNTLVYLTFGDGRTGDWQDEGWSHAALRDHVGGDRRLWSCIAALRAAVLVGRVPGASLTIPEPA